MTVTGQILRKWTKEGKVIYLGGVLLEADQPSYRGGGTSLGETGSRTSEVPYRLLRAGHLRRRESHSCLCLVRKQKGLCSSGLSKLLCFMGLELEVKEQVLAEVRRQVQMAMQPHQVEISMVLMLAGKFWLDFHGAWERPEQEIKAATTGLNFVVGVIQLPHKGVAVYNLGINLWECVVASGTAATTTSASQGTAMATSISNKSSEPEQVKPGISELARLPELSETSCIDVGDWLYALECSMGDLSLCECHCEGTSMLLALTGALPVLGRVLVLYRPGSTAERQQILKALELPAVANTAVEAVDALRRYTLEMDVKPTQKAVEDLHQALLSEFEQVAFRGCRRGTSYKYSHEVDRKQKQGDEAASEEINAATMVRVQLANGEGRRGLEIKHLVHGTIRPKVVGPCPLIGEVQALELIRELEEKRVDDLQRSTAAIQRSLWIWDYGCCWSRHLEIFLDDGIRSAHLLAMEAKDSLFVDLEPALKGSLAEEVSLTDKAGWNYLKVLLISRRKRKQLMSSTWLLNLFAGGVEGTSEFKLLILRGPWERIELSRDGEDPGILPSPPMRTKADEELLAKTMWCSLIAKAARVARGASPPFVMIEGAKIMNYMNTIATQEAYWAPKGLAAMDAGSFLESLSNNELEQWRIHLWNNHIPYNKKCKTGVVQIRTMQITGLPWWAPMCFRRFKMKYEMGVHMQMKYEMGVHTQMKYEMGVRTQMKYEMGGPQTDEVRDGGLLPDGCGLSDSGVPIHGGDFEPEVVEDSGHGVGLLREWQGGELFEVGDVERPSAEEELRLPKGMSSEEFQEIFSQVGGVEGYKGIYVMSPLRARELRSDPLKRWLASRGTYTTYTEGQSPQANGRAEVAAGGLRYAMWIQMQKQLYPDKELVPFGTRVHGKRKVYGAGGRYDLESRWGTGYYVGPSADVNEGSVIMMDKGNFITTSHMRPGLFDADREIELEDHYALVSVPSRRLRLLPLDGKKPKRFGVQDDDEAVWVSGAFVHGGVVGVLKNARRYPLVTKAEPHKDAHNVGVNVVMPLTDFEGCDMIVEKDGSSTTLKVNEDPQFFDPHDRHYTTPCTKGASLMLEGYSIRDSAKLNPEMMDCLTEVGFDWDSHRASEGADQGEVCRLAIMMMNKAQASYKEKEKTDTDNAADAERIDYVNADLDAAIQDLEDRAARLRDLLEEEEIMAEQAARLGQTVRDELGDARDYVCKYLDDVHKQLIQFQCLRERDILRSARTAEEGASDIDYEKLLDELEGDLDIVHTVPLAQVKRVLHKWTGAIEKEVKAFFDSGALVKIPYAEAKTLEAQGSLKIVPAKCIFMLKPPNIAGGKCRRKCRMVICGNFITRNDGEDQASLYAAGTSTDALRLVLTVASSRLWLAAIADITSAFLLAEWPTEMPKYALMQPKVIHESGDFGGEL
ncbi:unnamed protein product [Symbiodinium sp. CCMP2456]|nr:unnamed protein product [Symbiodinium sp. CCMP2456]